MENEWNEKSKENLNSDSTEKHNQEENNNGNIGREASAADFNTRDQVPEEKGQFGTTAEHGSGSLKNRSSNTKKDEFNMEGYRAGNAATQGSASSQTTRDRWNQGTEGSPGQGYSDDYTSGRRSNVADQNDLAAGGYSGAAGENYGTAATSAESQGIGKMHRVSGQDYQNQSTSNPVHNEGNTQIEGNRELNKVENRNESARNPDDDDFDEYDDPRNQLL